MIQNTLSRVLLFYLGETIILAISIVLCVWTTIKNKSSKGDKFGVLSIVITIFFIFRLFASVFPFVSDWSTNNVLSVEGMYSNTQSDAETNLLGIYGVTIINGDTELHLTTAPLHSKNDFPKGTFYATAYYTGESKILLYLDFDVGSK